MGRRGTVIWRLAVIAMLVATASASIVGYEAHRQVDSDAMLDASVSIRTVSEVTTDRFGDSVWNHGAGSGFLVSRRACEVWTNQHVIEGAALIEVFPRGWHHSHGIPAEVVAASPRHDVAVLHMRRCDGIREARIGDSRSVRAGDDTFAVGNPLGRNPDSITRGIISNVRRYVEGPTPYLQTDAAINPGSSGGALFNRRGEVVGMNTAIAASTEGVGIGIGYATPIDLVREVAKALKRHDFTWGDAGLDGLLSPLSVDEARVFGVPTGRGAVNVVRDPEQAPAAGRLRARDVIYQIGDTAIEDVEVALEVLSRHRPGEVVPVHVVRGGELEVVELPLVDGARPTLPPEPEFYEGYLGMRLEMWSKDNGHEQSFPSPVITAIKSLGPAHRGLISSSQRAAALQGPFAVTFQLDVKTVAGVVYHGAYHPVTAIDVLDRYAAQAFRSGDPLLLEIELWSRDDPRDLDRPLEPQGTAFFKVVPAVTSAAAPVDPEDLMVGASG